MCRQCYSFVRLLSHSLSIFEHIIASDTLWNMHGFDITAIYVLILDKVVRTLSVQSQGKISDTHIRMLYIHAEHIYKRRHTHTQAYKNVRRDTKKKNPQNQQEPGKIAMSNAKREYYVPYHSPRHVYTLAFTNIFVRSQCKVYTRLRSINSVCFVFDIVVSFYSIHHTGSELDVFDLRIGGEVL